MHFSIYFNIFHHIFAVSLQTAVKVVEILNTAHLSGCCIKEFCGNGFRNGVIALLLITAYQIVAFFFDHTIQLWYFIRGILKISIHRNDNVTQSLFETTIESRTLTVVATEFDSFSFRMVLTKFRDNFPTVVSRTIVNEDNLVCEVILFHNPLNPGEEFGY